ncbi:hypothetical protein DGG96_09375 [Legionella qingyii]|uniref:Uncharacterized protein n=1 Tax=Legionella qingyii TaxID=2184757 RepID=A0A317U3W7_9GAMM|nr:hypothetical protein DGG96_09375 [Legionella qingyii]
MIQIIKEIDFPEEKVDFVDSTRVIGSYVFQVVFQVVVVVLLVKEIDLISFHLICEMVGLLVDLVLARVIHVKDMG